MRPIRISRWMRAAARLYPASWRRRYGAEFEALLEDSEGRWIDFFNIIHGAITMQFRSWSMGKLVLAACLAGGLIPAAAALLRHRTYESTSVMRFDSAHPLDRTIATNDLIHLEKDVLSETSLEELIAKYNLYPAERNRTPVETLAQRMRDRDIMIRFMETPGTRNPAFAIRFSYADAATARAVNRDLVSRFIEGWVHVARHDAKHGIGSRALAVIELLDPPSLPQRPVPPDYRLLIPMGLGTGLLCGLTAGLLRRFHLKLVPRT